MNLKKIRREKGLNQSDLAKILNVEQSAISKYELGKTKLTHDQVIKLSIALEVTPNELLGFEKAYRTYTEYLNSLKQEEEPD